MTAKESSRYEGGGSGQGALGRFNRLAVTEKSVRYPPRGHVGPICWVDTIQCIKQSPVPQLARDAFQLCKETLQ